MSASHRSLVAWFTLLAPAATQSLPASRDAATADPLFKAEPIWVSAPDPDRRKPPQSVQSALVLGARHWVLFESEGRVFVTRDAGRTWQQAGETGVRIGCLARDRGGRWWTLEKSEGRVSARLGWSEDNGEHWRVAEIDTDVCEPVGLAIHADGAPVMAGLDGQVWKLDLRRQPYWHAWSRLGQGVVDRQAHDVAIAGTAILVAGFSGIHASDDDGRTWHEVLPGWHVLRRTPGGHVLAWAEFAGGQARRYEAQEQQFLRVASLGVHLGRTPCLDTTRDLLLAGGAYRGASAALLVDAAGEARGPEGMTGDGVHFIGATPDGTILAGDGDGFYRLDTARDRWTRIWPPAK